MSFDAPGSLILLGEYAVLSGKKAIISTINKRIRVTITPRKDNQLNIHSELGQHFCPIHQIKIVPPFEFVLATLQSKILPSGCDIFIESEFSSYLGLGSSAAVTVALHRALNHWLNRNITKKQLWHETKAIVTRVQGQASGADLAASIYGGTIVFQNNPLKITRLKQSPMICAIYSGKKTTTQKAIEIVSEKRKILLSNHQSLDDEIDQLSTQAIHAINQNDRKTLGNLFNQAQNYMDMLGVSNNILNDIIQTLRRQPTIFGAKISGSGLGDCAIGLGQLNHEIFPENERQKALGVKQLGITAYEY